MCSDDTRASLEPLVSLELGRRVMRASRFWGATSRGFRVTDSRAAKRLLLTHLAACSARSSAVWCAASTDSRASPEPVGALDQAVTIRVLRAEQTSQSDPRESSGPLDRDERRCTPSRYKPPVKKEHRLSWYKTFEANFAPD